MNVLEKDLEDLVYETAKKDANLLRQRGLPINGYCMRQVNLGDYGIADMVCFEINDYCIEVQVVELKKEVININTLMQAARYAKPIKDAVEKAFRGNRRHVFMSIILVGKKIETSGDFVFLLDYTHRASAYTVEIDLEKGVVFNHCAGYRMVDARPLNIPAFGFKELRKAFSNG